MKRSWNPSMAILDARPAKHICPSSRVHGNDDEDECIILIGGRLLTLRRTLLTNNSPVFAKLLQRPTCDVIPFIDLTQEDTIEDFTELYWALTTEPKQRTKTINWCRLQSIFCMATKYKFTDCREWSKQDLIRFSRTNDLERYPLYYLRAILQAVSQDPAVNLQGLIGVEWVRRLKQDPTLSSKDALDFAEQHNLRKFRSLIYYTEATRIDPVLHASRRDTYKFNNGFNSEQSANLSRGFESIKRFWESLRPVPYRKVPSNRQQDHDQVCAQEWVKMWQKGCNRIFCPRETLILLQNSAPTRTHDTQCGCHFRKEAAQKIRKLSGSLIEYFLPIEPYKRWVCRSDERSPKDDNLDGSERDSEETDEENSSSLSFVDDNDGYGKTLNTGVESEGRADGGHDSNDDTSDQEGNSEDEDKEESSEDEEESSGAEESLEEEYC